MHKIGIALLANSVVLIAFLSVVANQVEKGVELEYSRLPETRASSG
jgi:hypothetical protein